MLLGYTGVLRYNELVHIKANNLLLFSSHVEVVIESSKTDIKPNFFLSSPRSDNALSSNSLALV
jgi:hypothetical protein